MIYKKFQDRSKQIDLKTVEVNGRTYGNYAQYFSESRELENEFREALAKEYCGHLNHDITDKIYEKACYLSGADGDFEKAEEYYAEFAELVMAVLHIAGIGRIQPNA